MTAISLERLADRLRRRGEFRLYPSTRIVRSWTDEALTTHSEYGPCWSIAWWPNGQGPGRHEGMGNPFAQRGFTGDSIEEVFRLAFEGTTPPPRDIDTVAWHRKRERERRIPTQSGSGAVS
jgi:hypothetical protein